MRMNYLLDAESPALQILNLYSPLRLTRSLRIPMQTNIFSGGLLATILALSALAKANPDLPPRTPTSAFPARRAPQTATPDPPLTSLQPDPSGCATENIQQYFDGIPLPSGGALSAIAAYLDEVAKPCIATLLDPLSCTISDPTSWCGITTFAAQSVLTSYLTYASAAGSFVEANGATIAILSTSCPAAWARPGMLQQAWLKIALANGQCYLQAHGITVAGGGPSHTTTSGRTTPTGSDILPAATVMTTTTSTTSKGAAKRLQSLEGFAIMGVGLVMLVSVV